MFGESNETEPRRGDFQLEVADRVVVVKDGKPVKAHVADTVIPGLIGVTFVKDGPVSHFNRDEVFPLYRVVEGKGVLGLFYLRD
jgi:hypothetical protein